MTIADHALRVKISSKGQHPLKHDISDFAYTNPALPGVTQLEATIDWLVATLYPKTQPSVANVAALPAAGNTLLDYRVVLDDGDGKAASYRWEQREGDAVAKWYKIYDMDWGETSILSNFLVKTQDVYVYKYGHDDVDDVGAALAGDLAGQFMYGGASAGTHLTLYANSGDGVGADTGFVQFGDDVRPLVDSATTLGANTYRFLNIFTDSIVADSTVITGASITDTSGAISFDNENLTTTGNINGAIVTGSTSGVFGTATVTGGSITDTSGAISFGDENLSTTGSITGASGIFGTLTLSGGSITDSSGAISFGNENLTTTGTLGAGVTTVSQLNVDDLRLDANTLSVQTLNTDLILVANGTGDVDIQSPMTTLGQIITGVVEITGQLDVDNIRTNGNTFSSTDINGDINLSPDGTGVLTTSALFRPTTNNTLDLGASGNRFKSLFIGTSINDGTIDFTTANLMTFATVGAPSNGDVLFWSTANSRWEASGPDTEVDHGSISGLLDDDHTQYPLLIGRATGQDLIGGIAASETLTLESTSHATKGTVLTKDSFLAFTNASYAGTWSGSDIGASSNRFRHIFTSGEHFGFRLENLGSDPVSSVQNPGRLWWRTDTDRVRLDTGTSIIDINNIASRTETVWDGIDTVKNVDVTASTIDAREAIWQLKDNTNDFENVYAKIEATTATNVRITVNVPLPAGTYRLIGLE